MRRVSTQARTPWGNVMYSTGNIHEPKIPIITTFGKRRPTATRSMSLFFSPCRPSRTHARHTAAKPQSNYSVTMAQLQSLITKATPTSALLLTSSLLGLWLLFQLFSYLRDPLKDIPGPFWARFTRLWYFREVANGQFEKTNVALHRKYGAFPRQRCPQKSSINEEQG